MTPVVLSSGCQLPTSRTAPSESSRPKRLGDAVHRRPLAPTIAPSDRTSLDTSRAIVEFDKPPRKGAHIWEPNARPEYFESLLKEGIFVFTVMMAVASTTFLQGALVINTANIGANLHAKPVQVTWITAAVGYVRTMLPQFCADRDTA